MVMEYRMVELTKDYLASRLDEFIDMCHNNIPDEYWQAEHFLSDLKNKWRLSSLLLGQEEQLIGFLIASEKETSVHIHKFVIDKSFQGEGLGRRLLGELETKAHKSLTLKVALANVSAVSFYLKNGFEISGQQDEMYLMNKKYDESINRRNSSA